MLLNKIDVQELHAEWFEVRSVLSRTAHEELMYLRSDIYLENKIELLRQKLDRYCQIIIWGDKNNTEFFE